MTRYLIFGPGRVGTNMAHYLEHLGHIVVLVGRAEAERDQQRCMGLIKEADIIGVAIPDDKLSVWFDQWGQLVAGKCIIHFSGALTVDGMKSFHPLYSFPKSVLPVATMEKIAFACPVGGPTFSTIFPSAVNPHFEIADHDRARYHALAVLSGNLASYIWNQTAEEFSTLIEETPEEILKSYLGSIVDRFVENPTASLTGPVARRDRQTVEKNLDGLANNANLKKLYEAFLDTAWPEFSSAPNDPDNDDNPKGD